MDLHAVLSLACHYAGVTPDKFFDDPTERHASAKPFAARVAAIIILQREAGMSRREISAFLGMSFGAIADHLRAESIARADDAIDGGLHHCVQAILADEDIDDPEYIDDWQPQSHG